MSSLITSMSRRAVILQAINKHSRELTQLLHDLKRDLNQKFIMFLMKLETIPEAIHRDGELYNENLRNAMFEDIINKFISSRTSKEFRTALRSGMGIKILQRIIRERLWEFLRGRLRQVQLHGLQHFIGNLDEHDDIDHEDMDNEAEDDSDVQMSDSDSPPVVQKPRAKPLPQASPSTSPHQTRATTNSAQKSLTQQMSTVTRSVQPLVSNTNQRIVPSPKAKSPRGPNNNTPPSTPRTNEKSSAEPKRKPKSKPNANSTNDSSLNKTDKFALLVTYDTAADFHFDITDVSELQLVTSDHTFTPPATGSAAMLIGAYNLAGLTSLSGFAFKGVLMLTTRQRSSLMFCTDGDEFYSVAAPYVDRNIRLYVTAIDLSSAAQLILTPQRLERRFHMFVCVLSAYAFKIGPKKFAPLLKSSFCIDTAGFTRDILIAAIADLPFASIRKHCYNLVSNAASLVEFHVMPSFTLLNARSSALEEVQSSRDDYEKALMHIGVNLLAPEEAKNSTYPTTEALFRGVVLSAQNNATASEMYQEIFTLVSDLFN